MSKYNFYYDESEHSRKINHKTITAENYSNNFVAVVVGWLSENQADLCKRYAAFEEKYQHRQSNGELKSTTIKPRRDEIFHHEGISLVSAKQHSIRADSWSMNGSFLFTRKCTKW